MEYTSKDNVNKLIINARVIIDLNSDKQYKYDTTSLYREDGTKIIYVEENGDVMYLPENRKVATLYKDGEITRIIKDKEVVIGELPREIVAQNRKYKTLPNDICVYKTNILFVIAIVLISAIVPSLAIFRMLTAYSGYILTICICVVASIYSFYKSKKENIYKTTAINVVGTLLIFTLGTILFAPTGRVNIFLDLIVIMHIIGLSILTGNAFSKIS